MKFIYRKNIIILLSTIFICTSLHGQVKLANNWFFGRGAGLTWDSPQDNITANGVAETGTGNAVLSGLPAQLTGSVMWTVEGCFSLSDSNGDILFYSDGSRIYNKNNVIMLNGDNLAGNYSSAQSGIMIPYPLDPTKYIVVTLIDWFNQNEASNSGNICYSVIDLNGDGGNGEIITGQKNVPLLGATGITAESVTSVQHANGQDYWIVAPGKSEYQNAFPNPSYPVTSTALNVWLVDENGVNATAPAHIYTFPMDSIAIDMGNPNGYLRFSPDGRQFVWATWLGNTKVIYGNFDNRTGEFSNIKAMDNEVNYGVSFSRSGKYLYLSNPYQDNNQNSTRGFRVYDFVELLNASEPNTITPIKSYNFSATERPGGLQLGPDGRLYMSLQTSDTLRFVDNPEDPANLRMYDIPHFFQGRGQLYHYTSHVLTDTTLRQQTGISSFADYLFRLPLSGDYNLCMNTEGTYRMSFVQGIGNNEIINLEWDFGDGNIVNQPITSGIYDITQTHTFTKSGDFRIKVTPQTLGGGIDDAQISTFEVKVTPCLMPVNPNIHWY